ncbi:hypothetical protein [Cupriavidus sp. WS]|uniref:hypothetical protein n=1 Tax=Cupriavidus sp. WS TaxID=1312922 RepID=UPI0012DEA3F2|nr:hypothetical protein [Cupriavidus sp. WS]
MEETLKKAQAAADRADAPMYVFRTHGPNGHEVSWFNATGVKNSPKDDLYQVVEPQSKGTSNENGFKLTLGKKVLFEANEPKELAHHLVKQFPPNGDFPSPNPHNAGFAIILPNGDRLQGLRAERWVRQNR